MDGYKEIIKSAKARRFILNSLRFVPDGFMLSIQYHMKLHRRLRLNRPVRFTEKLQWYKMHYRNPVMHQCVDKYLVREYVREKGLEHILIPLIGKYASLEEISWNELPDQFVIKTTDGSGGLNIVICRDKAELNVQNLRERIKVSRHKVKNNTMGREWAYYGLQPGIVVEELLTNKENPEAGIHDYKFFCYNGHAKYVILDVDRYVGHKRDFYDREWNNLHVLSDCPAIDREIPKPENLNEMLRVAEKLAADFPFVRVDLYNIQGKVFFGELTFYPWSGYVEFVPDQWDAKFGEDFELVRFGSK